MEKILNELRREIDLIDEELLKILAKRLSVVIKIGKLKKEQNISLLDDKRRKDLFRLITKKAESFNLSEEFVKKLFQIIHDHSIDIQKKI